MAKVSLDLSFIISAASDIDTNQKTFFVDG